MKSNLRPHFNLTVTIHTAVQILLTIGSACGYTCAELKDLEHRIVIKAHQLVEHIEDEDAACNPHRLVFLAMNDLRVEHDVWHRWFTYRRLYANQKRYAEWWSRLEPEITVARIILPLES